MVLHELVSSKRLAGKGVMAIAGCCICQICICPRPGMSSCSNDIAGASSEVNLVTGRVAMQDCFEAT